MKIFYLFKIGLNNHPKIHSKIKKASYFYDM